MQCETVLSAAISMITFHIGNLSLWPYTNVDNNMIVVIKGIRLIMCCSSPTDNYDSALRMIKTMLQFTQALLHVRVKAWAPRLISC